MDPTTEGMEMQDEGFGGSLSEIAGATARLAPEEVDLVGLLTKGTEVVAAGACGAPWAWSGRVERRQVAA